MCVAPEYLSKRLCSVALLLVSTVSTTTCAKLNCVLPKPKVEPTGCQYSDGSSKVTPDCSEIYFGLPSLASYDQLPGDVDKSWYYVFAEQLVLSVADHPPWGAVQRSVKGEIEGKQLIPKLMKWELHRHFIVSIVVCVVALGFVVWSLHICAKLRKRNAHHYSGLGQRRQRNEKCRLAMSTVLVLLLILLSITALVTCHILAGQWSEQHGRQVSDSASRNLDVYVNNTIGIASHLVNNQLAFLLGTATQRLDALGHLIANRASWLVYNATNDVTEAVMTIVGDSHRAVDALNTINRVELSLLARQKSIIEQLQLIKDQASLLDCLVINSSSAQCTSFQDNITALAYLAHYNTLPNVTRVAKIAEQVYNSDISKQAQAVWPMFQGIPCDIQTKTASFLTEAKKEVVKLHSDVVKQVDELFPHASKGTEVDNTGNGKSSISIHNKTVYEETEFSLIEHGNDSTVDNFWTIYGWRNLTEQIWSPVDSLFTTTTFLNVYWSRFTFASVSLLLAFILVPALFCAERLRGCSLLPEQLERRCRWCSPINLGKFYHAGMPVVVAILLLTTALVYAVAGTAGIFCKPLNSMDVLNETIDNVPAVFPHYVLSEYVLPKGSPPMTIRQLLEHCEHNESLYRLLRLDRRADIHKLFNISTVKDLVDRHLSQASSAFSIKDRRILTISAQLKLLKLRSNSSGLKSISFKSLDDACAKPVLSSPPSKSLQELYEVMNELSQVARKTGGNTSDAEHGLSQQSLQLVTLRQDIAKLVTLVQETNNLRTMLCDKVDIIKSIVNSAVDQIPRTLNLADNLSKTLQAKAPDLVQKMLDTYVHDLYSWSNTFFNYSIDVITNKLGNCRPVSDIWHGVVNTTCGNTAPGLNTVVVLLVLCCLLSIPTIKLVPALRRALVPTSDSDLLILDEMQIYGAPLDDLAEDGVQSPGGSGLLVTMNLKTRNSQEQRDML